MEARKERRELTVMEGRKRTDGEGRKGGRRTDDEGRKRTDG